MRRAPLLTALTAVALAVGAAPAVAATPGSANDRLVAKWYADFLGRADDEGHTASGRAYWVDQLDSGQDPRRILDSILSSAEFADDTVDRYYEVYLGRDADEDFGANFWKSGIRADMEPEWVEQNVLASSEFERRTGDRRIEQWYRAILGRTGSNVVNAGERDYWQGRAAAVGSLNAVREIWYSAEGVERRIRDAYADLLGRTGTQVSGGEIDYWYDQAFDSRLGLRVEIALSPGYRPGGGSGGSGTGGGAGGEQYSGPAQLRVVSCEVVSGGSGQGRTLEVRYELENVATRRLTYDVVVEAVDTDGDRLAVFEDSLRVDAGQTRSDSDRARTSAAGEFAGDCTATEVTPRL